MAILTLKVEQSTENDLLNC